MVGILEVVAVRSRGWKFGFPGVAMERPRKARRAMNSMCFILIMYLRRVSGGNFLW